MPPLKAMAGPSHTQQQTFVEPHGDLSEESMACTKNWIATKNDPVTLMANFILQEVLLVSGIGERAAPRRWFVHPGFQLLERHSLCAPER